jgi:hypothetical protein
MEDPSYKEQTIIHKSTTDFRANHLINISYNLSLTIMKGSQYYGTQIISFDLKSIPNNPIPIDFHGPLVKSLTINHKK